MQYINISTGLSVGIQAIRAAHPTLSIPDGADLSDLGYAQLVGTPQPTLQPGEYLTSGPAQQVGGEWHATWVINPPPVPVSVSKFQAIEALERAGYLGTVEAIMSAPETPEKMKRAWTHATEFLRDSPTVAALAGVLGLDSAALDALFVTAAGISA